MKRTTAAALLFLIPVLNLFAQVPSKIKSFNIPKGTTITMDGKNDVWAPVLFNHQLPKPNQVHGAYYLHTITNSLGLQQEEFDPKIIYDPVANRFITVILNGFTDSTSNVLVGFSETDSTYGAWNFYALPGNPLNDTSWTDFPMASITGQELFITVNLLYNDSSWQAGFRQTIVWQIKKSEGYSGATLNPFMHYGINHGGRPVRNFCPVK